MLHGPAIGAVSSVTSRDQTVREIQAGGREDHFERVGARTTGAGGREDHERIQPRLNGSSTAQPLELWTA
jgi:hypothetical protein